MPPQCGTFAGLPQAATRGRRRLGRRRLGRIFIAEELGPSYRPRLTCYPVEAGRAAFGEHPWLRERRDGKGLPQGWVAGLLVLQNV